MTVFWVWCLRAEHKCRSEHNIAPDVRKSTGWKLYCFGIGDGLVVVLHKLFVVCEHVQIGEVETIESSEMRLLKVAGVGDGLLGLGRLW